jgi:hypothetical protein
MMMRRLSILIGVANLAAALAGCGGGGGTVQQSGSRAGAISGRAVNDRGQPIKGAKVQLLPGDRAAITRAIVTTSTDVDGHFLMENVAAGTYTVSVSTTNSAGTPVDVQVTVTVPAGTTIDLTITVHQSSSSAPPPNSTTGSISGRVINVDTGGLVSGAVVIAKSRNGSSGGDLRVFTSADGTFHFGTVPPGLWEIRASKGDFQSSRVLVDVTAGVDSQVDVAVSSRDHNG